MVRNIPFVRSGSFFYPFSYPDRPSAWVHSVYSRKPLSQKVSNTPFRLNPSESWNGREHADIVWIWYSDSLWLLLHVKEDNENSMLGSMVSRTCTVKHDNTHWTASFWQKTGHVYTIHIWQEIFVRILISSLSSKQFLTKLYS